MICHYYWLIEPIRDTFKDTSEREPAFSVNIELPTRKCVFGLFTDAQGKPEYARLTIPGCEKENEIPDDMVPVLQGTKEHLLSVLRLSYDPDIKLFPRPIWAFHKEGEKYSTGLKMTLQIVDPPINAERIKQFFGHTLNARQQIKLLADGNDQHIPLQYRFLSLYKILELAYNKTGAIDQKAMDTFLQTYEADFKALKIKQSPKTYLHNMRDKCAHIRTGNSAKRMVLGVTHLDPEYVSELTKFMPLFFRICVDLLNTAFGGNMKIRFEKQKFGEPELQQL